MATLKVYYEAKDRLKWYKATCPIARSVTRNKTAYLSMIQNEANNLYEIHESKTDLKVFVYLSIKSKANATK